MGRLLKYVWLFFNHGKITYVEREKFGLYRNGKPGVIKQIQGHQLDSKRNHYIVIYKQNRILLIFFT